MSSLPENTIDLLKYLIMTYNIEKQTVMDFTMVSGSTGVACNETKRDFIGIAKIRIEEATLESFFD